MKLVNTDYNGYCGWVCCGRVGAGVRCDVVRSAQRGPAPQLLRPHAGQGDQGEAHAGELLQQPHQPAEGEEGEDEEDGGI